MDSRKMMLPDGWYPHNSVLAEKQIHSWETIRENKSPSYISGIGPHAGWFYSGEMACKVVCSIPENTELVVIAGGHLSKTSSHMIMNYSSFETPFGSLSFASDMADILCKDFKQDYDPDNTVEIYLPLIKYFFPEITVLPVRLAPHLNAAYWGSQCFDFCRENNIKAFFLGSTDLSHYGVRFSFTDYGLGSSARKRVYQNDRELLEKLCHMDINGILKSIETQITACSGGAALGACGFAGAAGAEKGKILDHKYSYDISGSLNEDFVGYGSIIYS